MMSYVGAKPPYSLLLKLVNKIIKAKNSLLKLPKWSLCELTLLEKCITTTFWSSLNHSLEYSQLLKKVLLATLKSVKNYY